jgi:dTDP-4-amino-4,6-dideoxygalactose transaminase
VLRGDMSLVGPRPLLVEYLPLYSKEQVRRHEVRPGITGWAQINGRNARLLHDAVTSGGSFRSPWPSERIDHAWYRYHCFAENREERDRILEQMHEAGVPCFQGPCPEIYREQAFADAGFVPADRLPVARHLGETSLQFLTYHTIDEASMHQAANRVAEVLERV